MNISYLFVGSVAVSVTYDHIASLLNLCMYYCIPYTDFTPKEDCVTLRFRLSAMRKLKKVCSERGVIYTVLDYKGLPAFLERYKYRWGIAVGIICAATLVFLSGCFIWDIRVTGNENITSAEVIELLDGYGFSVGTYIPSVNTDKLENKLLIDSRSISWISVNIVGTVAEVQIREYSEPKIEETALKPANLVAKKSGVVEEVRIFRGKVMVKPYQYVEKGTLLVSGIYDSERVGFRYTRASGAVMARTTNEYYVEIPYEYEDIRYTGEEYCDKYLNFFDFSINISKNSGKEGVLYDKIDIVENCSLFEGLQTPLETHTVRYLAYEKVQAIRTAEEAEALAYYELSELLGEAAEDSVIIRKTITPKVGEDSFSLYCVVTAIEDIAKLSEFEVDMGAG